MQYGFSFKDESSSPMTIGMDNWIGYAPIYVANEKFFKENNVDVRLVITHQDYTQTLGRYANNTISGMAVVFSDLVYENQQGTPVKIIYAADYSGSADSLIGNYSTVKELKGKTIGIEGVNTFSHIFVLKLLEKNGLSEKDVRFSVVPHSKTLEALKKGEIQAGHIWGQTRTDALNSGYRVIATANDVPGLITDVLVINPEIIEKRPDEVQRLVYSIIEARNFMDTNRTESIKMISKTLGITETEAENQLLGIHLLTPKESLDYMTNKNMTSSLYHTGSEISKYYVERGQLNSEPNLDELIDSSFIRDAEIKIRDQK